jgi:ABC-type phosphate transport system substrate-binding protein
VVDRNRLFILSLALTLAACQAASTLVPTAETYQTVFVSPAVLPLASQWLQAFNQQSGRPTINLIPMSYTAAREAVEEASAAIVISAQAPPSDWWATPLGTQPIAVVTNASNPIEDLTRSELLQIISGQVTNWESWTGESTRVEVIFPVPGDELRARFMDQLSPGLRLSPSARLAADPAMVIQLVEDDPGRIAILPFAMVTPELNVIRIDGMSPDDEGYPFNVDLLATAPQEPEGSVRQWLVWLQERLGIHPPASQRPEATRTVEPTTPSPTHDGSPSTSTPPPTRTPSASQTAD